MSIDEKILENIPYTYILWKKDDSGYKCCSSNSTIENNCTFHKYINTNYKNFESYFWKFIEDRNIDKTSRIKMEQGEIILKFIDETHFLQTIITSNACHIIPTLSYKLRGPLTNIIGVLNIIKEDSFANKKDKKYYNILKKSSYDIMDIANDLVDIINLSRNNIKLEIQKTNLIELLSDCKKILASELKEKNLNLIIIYKQNLPQYVLTDPNRLKQIILSLLSNAIKFTEIGSIIIDASLVKKTNTDKYPFVFEEYYPPIFNILFKIKDNGQGISKDIIPHINNILDINSQNHKIDFNKSIGYGLVITKFLCDILNARIWYKTEKDIGTIFYFNLICKGEFDDKLIT